ncbi:MAG TPA: AAA family ATPase [Verrucomicrobiae bacterium]|nr:AAA family ATPase [Verrucomicrobiae bacterium]
MPGGFNEKRPANEVRIEIERKRKDDSWIVEGVFGELAELFLPRADCLIFLDLDWTACWSALVARGSESSKQLPAANAEGNFKKLLLWAEQYWTRTNSCSQSNHLRLFSNFTGVKFRFIRRSEIDEFLRQQERS